MAAFKPAGIAIAAGFAAVGAGIAGVAAVTVKEAIAGVKKTVDLTAEEFDILNQSLKDMTKEIPKSYVELASIAEIAGQLGVEGVDNITTFTETIADIGVTTNMTAEQAATDFARFANIMGMPISEVDRLGSTVVDLGNNLATTESEIVDMSMRIAGAGSTLGMTEGQVMGWGAALSSMGIRAEMGGTAISKLMINISAMVSTGSEELTGFAETAGMTTEEFSKLFKEDASAALQAFFNGLGTIKEQGGDVLSVLEELDIKEVRLRDATLRLASGSDTLNDSLNIQKKAWEENTALSEEAEKRYATLESQIQIVKNEFMLLAVEIGEKLMPIVRDRLLPFLKDDLMPAISSVVSAVENLIDGWKNLSPEMKGAIKIGLAATTMVLGLVVAAGVLSVVMGVLLSPILLVAVAIGALTAAGYYLWKNWGKIGIGIENIFIGIKNTVVSVWNGIVNTIATSINKVIGMINKLIRGYDKIATKLGVGKIGELGYADLSRYKAELTPYKTYTAPRDTYTQSKKPDTIININNLNGFNARDIAEQLQEELNKKISMG